MMVLTQEIEDKKRELMRKDEEIKRHITQIENERKKVKELSETIT